MHRTVIAAVVLAAAALGLAGLAWAQTTQPEPAPPPVDAKVSAQQPVPSKIIQAEIEQVRVYARWAAILAGLSLVTSLWVGWSLRTIAKNQVELAQLIVGRR